VTEPDLSTTRQNGPATAVAWLAVLAAYVALGLLFKSIFLNWIVGPLFPFAVMYLIPRMWRRGTSKP
jgi:hypothetical protein